MPSAFQRFRVDSELGSGGMARVELVVDQATGKRLARKRLKSGAAGDAALVELFAKEYLTLAQMRHPRIIEVYEYGRDDEGPYYTMELLDGSDLHDLSPIPYRQACRHLRDIASSLALLHARRLVHRDVSPRNGAILG